MDRIIGMRRGDLGAESRGGRHKLVSPNLGISGRPIIGLARDCRLDNREIPFAVEVLRSRNLIRIHWFPINSYKAAKLLSR